ncbi:MAG TPA: RluA family pseudouridine synthase [Magnetospirillaceae bacterium]|nr:RluA family pseudouridine synthase [Magnetospirillaceae bacterium]
MTTMFTASQSGERIDAYLARTVPEFSRSFWQKQTTVGAVKVNDVVVKPSYQLNIGDVITVNMPEVPDFSEATLPVLFEDDDVVVINKPAGVLTHAKGVVSDELTVATFVRPRTTDGVDTNRPGIVHRLDRATSGVIIAAKNSLAKRWLQKQFSTRRVKKTYIALVKGRPKEPAATIQLPIERNPKKPQTFRVGGNGKSAETDYETLEEYTGYTLLSLTPRTGRTHQLRVHMQYLGCPIVGDTLYGKTEPHLERMFLHAAVLELTLPSRERRVFEAPLPTELTRFLETLIRG